VSIRCKSRLFLILRSSRLVLDDEEALLVWFDGDLMFSTGRRRDSRSSRLLLGVPRERDATRTLDLYLRLQTAHL